MIVWYHYTIKQFYRQTNFVGDRHELSNGLYIGGKKEKKGRRVHQQSDILCDICAGCPIYQSYELTVQEMFGMQDWLILSLWIYISDLCVNSNPKTTFNKSDGYFCRCHWPMLMFYATAMIQVNFLHRKRMYWLCGFIF
jgi:hypothetical protein